MQQLHCIDSQHNLATMFGVDIGRSRIFPSSQNRLNDTEGEKKKRHSSFYSTRRSIAKLGHEGDDERLVSQSVAVKTSYASWLPDCVIKFA